MAGETLMGLFRIINQKKNQELLRKAFDCGRISHAYIFRGPEGCGHEAMALELAAMLNCEADSGQPCGVCSACKKMKNLEHSNLNLVFPVPGSDSKQGGEPDPFRKFTESMMEELQEEIRAKARNPYHKITVPKGNSIGIDFIRMIKRRMYLKSQEAGWKVTVIFDAHKMTIPAANSFLKIFEEPPEKSTFILTTSAPGNILETIQSRAFSLNFPPLTDEDIREELIGRGIEPEDAKLAANISNGNMETASNFDTEYLEKMRKDTLDIMRAIFKWNIEEVYDWITKVTGFYRQDADYFKQLMLSVSYWFRDAAALRVGAPAEDLIHSDLQEEIGKFVKAIPDFDESGCNCAVENCIDFIERNVYISLAVTNMFFQIKKNLNIRDTRK